MTMLTIKQCPTCGGRKIRRVRKSVVSRAGGRARTTPAVELYECPDCGERVYDRTAMRKIEAGRHSRVKASAA